MDFFPCTSHCTENFFQRFIYLLFLETGREHRGEGQMEEGERENLKQIHH